MSDIFDGYSALAPVYDKLNSDVNYSKWADFIEECFIRFRGEKPELVLDLGCGTGNMTFELAERGYDMTALDISEEMLAEAMNRYYDEYIDEDKKSILFLRADMTDFELYGTIDGVVCCLDGINHLDGREDVEKCFELVANYLAPKGVFIFDVNTPHKFRTAYKDNDYILEKDGAVCCWQNRLNESGDICDFCLTVFEKQANGMYKRRDGVTSEHCYTIEIIKEMLEKARLELVAVTSDYTFNPCDENADRWYIVAKSTKADDGFYAD